MADGCTVRALRRADAAQALVLYSDLTFGPACTDATAFTTVLGHPGTTVWGAFLDELLVGMTTLHLLPNVTWGARPYALVENVATAPSHRRRGIGRAVMDHAIDAAWQADAYKIMVMTGQKRGARGFYRALGFSDEDKFALVLRQPEAA